MMGFKVGSLEVNSFAEQKIIDTNRKLLRKNIKLNEIGSFLDSVNMNSTKERLITQEEIDNYLGRNPDNGKGDKMLFTYIEETGEIKNSINEDMKNLANHEAGTSWMRMGTLLSLDSTQQMIGAGFKALMDQNKILIKQNELLRRENEEIIELLKKRLE